jgi:hypothetical protein
LQDIVVEQYYLYIYINKGGITSQHAFKGNVVIFAQDLECAIEILNDLPLSLEPLFDFILVHFVGNTHLPMEIIKNCKFLYVKKCIITIWLTWLKSNHTKYKCTTINRHGLNSLSNNNIPDPIMRSILELKNI